MKSMTFKCSVLKQGKNNNAFSHTKKAAKSEKRKRGGEKEKRKEEKEGDQEEKKDINFSHVRPSLFICDILTQKPKEIIRGEIENQTE